MAERLRVREIDDDEGRRLVRIIRRGSGSVVTWRRAQRVLLSAQGMDAAAIAKVAFTSEDRVRDVIIAGREVTPDPGEPESGTGTSRSHGGPDYAPPGAISSLFLAAFTDRRHQPGS
ncbi:MAG: hypothetical protein QOE71_2360 [Pseudonocardiales bacterium]|nr:hypothetical protein [Pseudonocardiales bacterium]